MTTTKGRACSEDALASGAWRRGAACWGYGIVWAGLAGLALLTANLSAAPGSLTIIPAPGSLFAGGGGPHSVVLGDVNGDAQPDLTVASNNVIVLLLGNGDGSFQPAMSFAAGANPISVALGDVNGDGRPDLAVANEVSNDVSVLLNDAA